MERSTGNIMSKERIPVSMLIFPTIATPISCASLRFATIHFFCRLKLSHPVTGDTSLHISRLVEAEHNWDFGDDRVVRGKEPITDARVGGQNMLAFPSLS